MKPFHVKFIRGTYGMRDCWRATHVPSGQAMDGVSPEDAVKWLRWWLRRGSRSGQAQILSSLEKRIAEGQSARRDAARLNPVPSQRFSLTTA